MSNFFHQIWLLLWAYGIPGFLGIWAWAITGAIVYCNTLSSLPASNEDVKFFRYVFFCALCGPFGWICFPFWFLYRMCRFINITEIAFWLVGRKYND